MGNSTMAACSPGIMPLTALAGQLAGAEGAQAAVDAFVHDGQLVPASPNETLGVVPYTGACTPSGRNTTG